MASSVRAQSGRRAGSYIGVSYHLGRDNRLRTHSQLLNPGTVEGIGSLMITAPPAGNVVVIEHNLRLSERHEPITNGDAKTVEDVVRAHFSPSEVKFIRRP
jgi:hypothetical protein